MPVDPDFVWKQFRETLAALALPPDEQRSVTGPGCLACDLLNDFHYACDLFLSHCIDAVTAEQRTVIAEINAILSEMTGADLECFNDEVVTRPVWQSLRDTANEALRVFGCEGQTVEPFVEIQPGVWQRPAPQ